MKPGCSTHSAGVALTLAGWWVSIANGTGTPPLKIPRATAESQREVTLDDISTLRTVGSLSLSSDRRHFAIFVSQSDAQTNEYRTRWFVGSTHAGALIDAGDGGLLRPSTTPIGAAGGEISGMESRWSPDGKWIAYPKRAEGEVQLWRSAIDGSVCELLTHHDADVVDFEWSSDGRVLYFTAGTSRATLQAREESKRRNGYRYDEDVYSFTNLMSAELVHPAETDLTVWKLDLQSRLVSKASDTERAEFERTRTAGNDSAETPAISANGWKAWLVSDNQLGSHVMFAQPSMGGQAPVSSVACAAEACSGYIKRIWWQADRLMLWRGEGLNLATQAFYAWSPTDGKSSLLVRRPDDDLQWCDLAADRLLCARETKTLPPHIATITLKGGAIKVIADLNPEFRSIRLGRIERFEFDTPRLPWNEPGGALAGLYPSRAYGYAVYPPDFDPAKKYPVFVDPYIAHGFASSFGGEHALCLYAAKGFIVVNTAFPWPDQARLQALGASSMPTLYSAKLDFPHLTMLMESTLRGLDTIAARGFIDDKRVGIGGVSHGTFVPLYMLQKHDRIAALSMSSTTWGPHEYYWGAPKAREVARQEFGENSDREWPPNPDAEGKNFWPLFDIADHVDAIEAPILMNLADQESYGLVRLLRRLEDAHKPYDAYLFRNENHAKWQPAHLRAIQERNLDWFRFWLQDYEDPVPEKADQYLRWRKLREFQCNNSRSLRDFCQFRSDSVQR